MNTWIGLERKDGFYARGSISAFVVFFVVGAWEVRTIDP
jgi:hypothetical protein